MMVDVGKELLEDGRTDAVKPVLFAKALRALKPKLDSSKAQDAHEALKAIFEAIADVVSEMDQPPGKTFFSFSTEFPTAASNDPGFFRVIFQLSSSKAETPKGQVMNNFVEDLFGGSIQWTTKCDACEGKSFQREKIEEITLRMTPGVYSTVGQLMKNTVEFDEIPVFSCESCHQHTKATRKMKFRTTPPVLYVQLARFAFDLKSDETLKLCDAVDVEEQIVCLCSECETRKKHRYDLYCLVVHSGAKLRDDHFTCYLKNDEQSCWFLFNDSIQSQVADIEMKDILEGKSCHTPYLIFFKKVAL